MLRVWRIKRSITNTSAGACFPILLRQNPSIFTVSCCSSAFPSSLTFSDFAKGFFLALCWLGQLHPISAYIVGVCAALGSHGQNHLASGSSFRQGERGTELSVLAPTLVYSDRLQTPAVLCYLSVLDNSTVGEGMFLIRCPHSFSLSLDCTVKPGLSRPRQSWHHFISAEGEERPNHIVIHSAGAWIIMQRLLCHCRL